METVDFLNTSPAGSRFCHKCCWKIRMMLWAFTGGVRYWSQVFGPIKGNEFIHPIEAVAIAIVEQRYSVRKYLTVIGLNCSAQHAVDLEIVLVS